MNFREVWNKRNKEESFRKTDKFRERYDRISPPSIENDTKRNDSKKSTANTKKDRDKSRSMDKDKEIPKELSTLPESE